MVFAFVMIVSCIGTAGNANAASTDTGDITITGVASDNHTFNAYQIFSGTVAYDDSDNPFIGDIVWGSGISTTTAGTNYDTLYSALANIENSSGEKPFTSDGSATLTSAAAVAEKLSDSTLTADVIQKFMDVISQHLTDTATGTTNSGEQESDSTYTYTISNLQVGYYLVLDETTNLPSGEAYTSYLAEIVGTKGAGIETKTEEVTVSKVIDDGSTDGVTATTASAGDTITFKLTGTLPSDLSAYGTTYTYKFQDTLSSNLTYGSIESVVASKTGKADITFAANSGNNYYTVNTTGTENDPNLVVSIADAYKYAGYTITVTYTATLAKGVVAGKTESNSVYIEYSNNPNQGGNDSTGTTVTKTVYVNTLDLNVYKVDDSSPTAKALEGATFTLYKLTDIDQKTFEADEENYYTYTSGGTSMTQCQDGDTYSTGRYYEKVEDVDADSGTSKNKAIFNDLGEGTYVLVESTTPDGYNTAEAVQFVISVSEYDTDGSIKTWAIKDANDNTHQTVTKANSESSITTLETTIENKKGSNLPDTGGIGRTVFYILGSILVLGAVILLVTRRRMRSEE